MAHPLKGKLSIDVDDQIGIGNIGGIRIGNKPMGCAFFDPRELHVTSAYIDAWHGFQRTAGLRYVPHSWNSGLSGAEWAKIGSDYISNLETDGKRRIDAIEWDVETHVMKDQIEFLLGYEKPNPNGTGTIRVKGIRGSGGEFPNPKRPETLGYRHGRPGVWTMEGRQDTSTSAAAQAAQTGLLVGPQCYDGPMTENWDLWFEILTWVLDANPERPNGAKVSIDKILPYYDIRNKIMPVGTNESILFATSRYGT